MTTGPAARSVVVQRSGRARLQSTLRAVERAAVRHRLRCAVLVAIFGSSVLACGGNSGIIVAVIAPDGGDPFLGDDAASQARVTLLNDAGTTVVADVGASGAFQMDIRPQDTNEYSRLRVEALRGGEVIAIGMTPPAYWAALHGRVIPVLMQYRDALTAGPFAWPAGHADFDLVEFTSGFIGVFTAVASSNEGFHPEVYDLLNHGFAAVAQQRIAGEFDGDSTVAIVTASSGSTYPYIVRGRNFTSWAGVTTTEDLAPVDVIPSDRAAAGIVRSTAVRETTTRSTGGGGWFVGGRNADGPVPRVDHFDNIFALTLVGTSLMVPRVKPQIIGMFGATSGSDQPVWLVAGGNPSGTAFLELYSPDGRSNRRLDLGDHDRRDATVVCIATDGQGCARMLVVGGRVGSVLASDSLVLDGTAIREGVTPIVTAVGPALTHPRAGAMAAFAEGGAVVIAGGDDDAGAVRQVEMIDVSAVTSTQPPSQGHDVGTTCAHPAMLAVSNGSVMVTGGTHPDGTACTEIAFFRH